jgi:hypothetical protein
VTNDDKQMDEVTDLLKTWELPDLIPIFEGMLNNVT